jgi:hypothetical protein
VCEARSRLEQKCLTGDAMLPGHVAWTATLLYLLLGFAYATPLPLLSQFVSATFEWSGRPILCLMFR